MAVGQSVEYAWRSLRRSPAFTAAVVLTLAIGIGASAAIFTVVNAVLLRPLPYANPDRLVGVWHNLPPLSVMHAEQTQGTYLTYKRFARTIEGIALYDAGAVNVSDPDGRGEPRRITAAWTTSSLFPILGVAPLLGRAFTAAEDVPNGPDVVMISEGMWRSRFGAAPSVIGKRLQISGSSHEIIGVMPEQFRFPDAATQVWMPVGIDEHAQVPGGFSHFGIARLKPGITVEAAQRDFASVLPRIVDVSPNVAPGITTQMLLDQAKPIPLLVPMRDDVIGSIARTLWMVAGTAVLVLLVTCANVANLMLVRADGRQRELAVRAALGAGRTNVVMHFFTESVVLAGLAAGLGLGAAAVAIHFLVSAAPAEIPRLAEVRVDGAVIAFTVVVTLLVALVCSAIPAFRFARAELLSGLRDGGRGGTVGGHRQRARGVLVAAQMALALAVLSASGLLFRSFARLHAVRPGFNAENVTTLWTALPYSRYRGDTAVVEFYTCLVDRVAQIQGVQSVGISSRLPLHPSLSFDPIWVEGDASASSKIPPLQIRATTDGGYFRTMGIPLIAGRTFDRMDGRQHWDEAIVSQVTAAYFWHDSTGRAAIGKRFQALPSGPWYTVIGVVGSARDTSLSAPATPAVYFPQVISGDKNDNKVRSTMAIAVRATGDLSAMSREVQRVVHELDPTLPTFDARPMTTAVSSSIARLSFTMVILGVAAGVTLVLGVVGLYGAIAYVVTLRTRELGVRIALGAQPSAVAAMVTRQGIVLSAAGIVVGLAVVLVSARFLRSFLFEVAPTDPMTLGAASAVLVMSAALASWIPARRAARVDPMEALRAD